MKKKAKGTGSCVRCKWFKEFELRETIYYEAMRGVSGAQGLCCRYPKELLKSLHDFCGEFQEREES